MLIPPEPTVRAARRWLDLLSKSDVPRARALLKLHHEYSDLTPTQYEAGYELVAVSGLLTSGGRPIPGSELPTYFFQRVVAVTDPVWLRDADLLVRVPEELPADIARLAADLDLPERQAVALLGQLGGKIDLESRSRIGDAGERQLMQLLESHTTAQVEHVALISDALGYDILVELGSTNLHLEVKSTTRRNRLGVYISRNEFETMLVDPDWRMALVILNADLRIEVLLSVPTELLMAAAPIDEPMGRWESARIEIDQRQCALGIPELVGVLLDSESLVRTGVLAR